MLKVPEAAVEAATMSIQCDDELPCGEWTSRGVAERALDQAYPHIRRAVIAELVEKAEAKVQAILNANHQRTPVGAGSDGMAYTQAVIAKGWLRAELEGGDDA